MANESWFARWLQNGRLSALIFALVFITWVAFQAFRLPAPLLDQLVLTFGGVLVGNLALKKQSDDKKQAEEIISKATVVEEKVDKLTKEVHDDS